MNADIEIIREALQEFAYRPGQPVFSRYENAAAALRRIEARLADLDAREAEAEPGGAE